PLVADVACDREGPASFLFHEAHRSLRILVLLEVHEGNLRPFARHGVRNRAPDTALAAGDLGDAIPQPSGARKPGRQLRAWGHLGFAAGLPVLFLGRLGGCCHGDLLAEGTRSPGALLPLEREREGRRAVGGQAGAGKLWTWRCRARDER